jgi:hypothetical protein
MKHQNSLVSSRGFDRQTGGFPFGVAVLEPADAIRFSRFAPSV